MAEIVQQFCSVVVDWRGSPQLRTTLRTFGTQRARVSPGSLFDPYYYSLKMQRFEEKPYIDCTLVLVLYVC